MFYASLIFGLQSVSCQAEAVMDVGAGKLGAGGDYAADGSYANMDTFTNLGNVNIPFNNLSVNNSTSSTTQQQQQTPHTDARSHT